MPKIKVKKRVGIAEMIEKLLNGEIEDRVYKGSNECEVRIKLKGTLKVDNLVKNETFEIEVEEEVDIDVDAELENLVELYSDTNGREVLMNHEKPRSIQESINVHDRHNSAPLAFYILNDNHTMTLIWKDGEFVE